MNITNTVADRDTHTHAHVTGEEGGREEKEVEGSGKTHK